MTVLVEKIEQATDTKDEIVTSSTGNIFADMGSPDAEALMAKSVLALAIHREMKNRKMTQQAAATLFGTDRAKMSDLQRGRLSHFTFDCLMRFCNALGINVEITLIQTNHAPGTMQATANVSVRS